MSDAPGGFVSIGKLLETQEIAIERGWKLIAANDKLLRVSNITEYWNSQRAHDPNAMACLVEAVRGILKDA